MTLDHVAPRKGQTAFDRRDNLVLACPGCNTAKRDQAPMAFLLGARVRAHNLLRYGAHLSPMLVDLARSLATESSAPASSTQEPDMRFAKWFNLGGAKKVSIQFDIFNMLNNNPVLAAVTTFGPTVYRPNTIMQGRLMQIGSQFNF